LTLPKAWGSLLTTTPLQMISRSVRNPQKHFAFAPESLHGPLVAACFFCANSNGFASG
jgi:hypothetical protein